jgi:hypothetical protein
VRRIVAEATGLRRLNGMACQGMAWLLVYVPERKAHAVEVPYPGWARRVVRLANFAAVPVLVAFRGVRALPGAVARMKPPAAEAAFW